MMPGEGSRALTTFLKLGIQQAHSAPLCAAAGVHTERHSDSQSAFDAI